MEWSDLVGKKVNQVRINPDRDILELSVAGGEVIYLSAVGYCCSESWFEHIEGAECLIGKEIRRVVDREMPKDYDDGDFNVTRFYGWTIETDSGRCDLEMRNLSNGYYGGDVEIASDPLDQYRDKQPAENYQDMKVIAGVTA